jgi:hypothetical protein
MQRFNFDTGAIIAAPSPELTRSGYLRVYQRVARVGELQYFDSLGREFIQNVSRGVLFNQDSIESHYDQPITINHPPTAVSSANWSAYSVGHLTHDWVEDGDYLGFVSLLCAPSAINLVLSGKAIESSLGYDCDRQFVRGSYFDQSNRQINHSAIVPMARAKGARYLTGWGDSWQMKPHPQTDAAKTIPAEVLKVLTPKFIVDMAPPQPQPIRSGDRVTIDGKLSRVELVTRGRASGLNGSDRNPVLSVVDAAGARSYVLASGAVKFCP